jgi:DNA-binding NarL/FixJ family response regulator
MQAGVAARIRVALIDDQVLLREALGRLCVSDFGFEVAGQYRAVEDALPCCGNADVVLVRGRLLGGGAEIRSIRFLVIAETMSASESLHSLRLGACGIVSRDTPPEMVATAVRRVAQGGVWFDQGVIAVLARKLTDSDVGDRAADLNDREQQVLAGVYAGLTDRAIAASLGVKPGSVKATVRRLRLRAGARTRSQLIRFYPS